MGDASRILSRHLGVWAWIGLLVSACAPPEPHMGDPTAARPEFEHTTFARARSVALTGTADGSLYAVLGHDARLSLARSADGGLTFGAPTLVNPDAPAVISPFERPAVTAAARAVGVAWLSRDAARPGISVRYAGSPDRGRHFGPSTLINRSDEPETTMVQTAPGVPGTPAVAWLQNGKLLLARSFDAGATFQPVRLVDGQVCECCQPAMAIVERRILVAYRDLEHDGQGQAMRDIYLAASEDGGATFSRGRRVSDAHWYLDACPVSAPALARTDGRLLVLWMDGRNDSGHFRRSDIWLAASSNNGKTFSANHRLNPDGPGYRRWPDMAVDGTGRVHAVWVTTTPSGESLFYTWSEDGGRSFARPHPLLRSPLGHRSGTIASVSLVALPSGRMALAWVDNGGAHVGTWPAEKPPLGLTP